MRSVRVVLGVVAIVLFVALATAVSLHAQTAASSTVTGTVTDKTGATVPNAKVELQDVDTKAKTSVTTGSDGGYTFPSVRPANYTLTVSAKGFRQAVVSGLKVEIGKSALVNVTVEVGEMSQVVEVTAGAAVELQTLNASVGNVLDTNLLSQLPTLSRDATSLLLLQPMAIPGFNGPGGTGEGNLSGGAVAGARADQNTFMIDGGDATSNMEGGGGYNTGFVATPRAAVPTPVESLEEFRVQTNNAGADFTRSGGAEVQMVTKRGTNDWHGAGYFYHQNDELNANNWFRNNGFGDPTVAPIVNPEWRDNRYGGRVGGPIWKDRTFFFLFEEERHFFTQSVFSRLVPTTALRAGILKFKDCSAGFDAKGNCLGGTVRAYNLNPGATTDPDTGTSIPSSGFDPRGIGISPAILATWNLLPLPNDFSGGDGLRSALFTSTSPNTTNEHDPILRLDHKISDKWDFTARYQYSTSAIVPANIQEDIGGIAPGCKKGVPCPLASRPLQPRYLVAGLTGRLTPNLVNEFHFDWLRHWWSWIAPGAGIPVTGVNTGTNCLLVGQTTPSVCSDTRLQIWSESRTNGMVPINVNTQQARQRVWNGRDFTFIDNVSWVKDKHAWQFGGRAQIEHFLHVRDDKVVGGITTPLYFVARGGDFSNLSIGSAFRPTKCDPGDPTAIPPVPAVTTNCLRASDITNWKRAYISYLGLVDSATQVLTRAGDLSPQAPFTQIFQHDNVDSYELHFSDTWRITPSLTASYGLTWGVQMPPFDPKGQTAMMIDTSSGKVIDAGSLLNAKRQAALNGDVVNPVVGYVPIKATGRKYPYDPDYTNWGPRLAVAWNPGFSDGPMGMLFGNKKTVVRAGWGRAFDRLNGVGLVLTPALGIGFGDLSVCKTPSRAGVCDAGGDPNTNFRIGVDGNHITVPALPVVSGGVIIPGVNSVYENRDFRLDPKRRVGGTDVFDLSIQRELRGNMLLEVGYVGRLARDLVQNIDLNHIPYMFTPKGTNQSFAQAFDNVALALQTGKPVVVQPWFEAMMGGLSSPFCSGDPSIWGPGVAPFSSCTAAAVQFDSDNGNPYWPSHGAGALWFLLEPNFVTGPLTSQVNQIASYDWTMSNGHSAYHAAFVTLRKRPSHGLTFDVNYTFSHSLDTLGETQENTCAITDAFYVNRTYGPSLFDRRHTFNLLVTYDLPLGKGKGYASGALADKVLGGWNVAGVYTAASGLPLAVIDFNACATEFGSTSFNGAPIGLLRTTSGSIGTSRHNNPTTGTFGTDSTDTGAPNAFSNPDAIAAQFRYPTFADGRLGFGAIRGLFRWNVDFSLAKTTRITERIKTRFDVQFVNAFNHPMFSGGQYFSFEPGADLSSPESFGVMSSQFNSPRFIQIGLRFDF